MFAAMRKSSASGVRGNETMDEVVVLQTLKIRGRSTHEGLRDVLGPAGIPTQEVVDLLIDSGYVEDRGDELFLSDRGREELEGRLADERSSLDREALKDLYDKFCVRNDSFKKLATDWQMTTLGSQSVPNDHSDPVYDERVLGRLGSLHRRVMRLMPRVEEHLPRISCYSQRLVRAKARVDDGDHRFFTSLAVDSYHTVWFELHEELITCLEYTRHEGSPVGEVGGG